MSNAVEMVFWDVQHGHACYIKTPNGKHIVVDLGIGDYSGRNTAFSPLRRLKDSYGVDRLDWLIITHPHLDHIDDILNIDLLKPRVFSRPKQLTNEEVMRGVRDQDRLKFQKYCALNDEYSSPLSTGEDPADAANSGGVTIATFMATGCPHDNFNNHSMIAVVEYSDTKVVIPGDNEKCSFEELMRSQSFRTAVQNADVLLAPHHGRESGYYTDFVSLVNPRITIVSDGRFCDTSANDRYSRMSRGWTVHKRSSGTSSERKCLTTHSDGEVFVSFGPSSDPKYKTFLAVAIQ